VTRVVSGVENIECSNVAHVGRPEGMEVGLCVEVRSTTWQNQMVKVLGVTEVEGATSGRRRRAQRSTSRDSTASTIGAAIWSPIAGP